MKNQIKKYSQIKCIGILLFVFFNCQFLNAQKCEIDLLGSSYDDPNNTLNLDLGDNCIEELVRITFNNGVANVSWSGITDGDGLIQIITSDQVTIGALMLSDPDMIAPKEKEANTNLPPERASYTGQFDGKISISGNNYQLYAADHNSFSKSYAPPSFAGNSLLGSSTADTFNSVTNFNLDINGVVAAISAPAAVIVNVKYVKQVGTKKYCTTEMTKLDIAGGNLPPGVLIRESDSALSTGVTIIDSIDSAHIYIQSYFDIRIDVSTDAGVNWTTSDETGLMIMHNNVVTPTLSQWSLILLSLLVLSAGIFFILKR